MSAGAALQVQIDRALEAVAGLTGVYDGPPARAAYPYAVIDATSEIDWGHKNADGREVLAAVTVWDEQPARLHAVADLIEAAVAAIGAVDGWELVTFRMVRRRVVRDVAGPWAAAVDFRARMLSAN